MFWATILHLKAVLGRGINGCNVRAKIVVGEVETFQVVEHGDLIWQFTDPVIPQIQHGDSRHGPEVIFRDPSNRIVPQMQLLV